MSGATVSRRRGRAWCAVALLIVTSVGGVRVHAQVADIPKEDQEARDEWFWLQRTYPFKTRPYEAILFARRAASSGAFANRGAFPLLTGTWRPLGPLGLFDPGAGFFGSGPQLDAGRIGSIAPSVTAGGPLIIGTASGGVWRSSSLSPAWAPLTDKECSLNTGAVAVDPVNPSIVYAGTGELNQGTTGCGVLRSIDGGNTWTTITNGIPLGTTGAVRFGTFAIDRTTAGSTTGTILLAATNAGVLRSSTSGTSWTTPLTGGVFSVIAHPTRAGVFYAGDRDQTVVTHRGVFRSIDAGVTWTQLPALPVSDPTLVGRIEVSVSPAAPDQIVALVANATNSRLLGLYRFDQLLNTWTQLTATGVYTGESRGDFGAQASYDLAVAVDPRDANRIYVAGVRAFRSMDGGATFRPMANEIHCDWHTIVIDPKNPDILYAGTDGGLFISTDAGDTWTSRNSGLTITQYYPGIGINPAATVITGGSQDNGTHIFSGSPYWDGLLGGDGGYTAINYRDPTITYAETQWSSVSGGTISRRQGSISRTRVAGIVVGDRVQFIPPLVMDPVTPTKLYFGTFRLYRTVDEGSLWTPISADLSRGAGTITTIAVSAADTLTIYVGTTDGTAQVTRDGGTTFTNITAGLPARVITRMVVDPANAAHVLATVSGFGTGHIFESGDAGATWRNISGNLVDAPANSAAFVGAASNIFVGTDVGVFQTADDGASWQSGPAGLPNVVVQDLVYQPAAKLVLAGTFGRGMFSFAVGGTPAVLRGDVNSDGKVDAFDALLIQQSLVATLPNTTPIFPRGDANCNGTIDSGDVVLVLRAAVGLPTPGACVGTIK
ncbi:MAG: dockerin type I domain-containing protein [bacterium]